MNESKIKGGCQSALRTKTRSFLLTQLDELLCFMDTNQLNNLVHQVYLHINSIDRESEEL